VSRAEAEAAGWEPDAIDDEGNGQALCKSCHRRKTATEASRAAVAARRRRIEQRKRPPERHPGLL
jgi:hypothetical protein